jgi:membrane protein
MLHFANSLRRAFFSAMANDCFNIAQATAYSAIFALFPALIVAAALVGLIPGNIPLRAQLSEIFSRILPSNAIPLLRGYFVVSDRHSHHVLWSAVVISIIGSAGVIATLMEGFRRAYRRPLHQWGFWHKRRISFMLVPMSLFPLAIISLLVVSGHYITVWLWYLVMPQLRVIVIVVALVIRWVGAVLCSVSVIAVIYYKGTPVDHSFRRTLPGASIATGLWFLSTLGFGLYVTRFANYSQVYGSLGAGIALLVWLYIIALSVLIGAEFNAQLFGEGYNFPGYGETLRRIARRHRISQ